MTFFSQLIITSPYCWTLSVSGLIFPCAKQLKDICQFHFLSEASRNICQLCYKGLALCTVLKFFLPEAALNPSKLKVFDNCQKTFEVSISLRGVNWYIWLWELILENNTRCFRQTDQKYTVIGKCLSILFYTLLGRGFGISPQTEMF